MAVVSKQEIYLKNGSKFVKKITYSKGQFHIQLPDQLCEDMNYLANGIEFKVIDGTTEEAVNRAFQRELDLWYNAQTIKEKVILFEARFQGALATPEHRKKWQKGKYEPANGSSDAFRNREEAWIWRASDIDGFDNKTSIGLVLAWGVYEKTTVLGKENTKFLSGRNLAYGRSYSMDAFTEIAWTAEREEFFLSLDESFANMIAKVHRSLGDLTPEKLALLADNIKRLTF